MTYTGPLDIPSYFPDDPRPIRDMRVCECGESVDINNPDVERDGEFWQCVFCSGYNKF